MMENHPENRFSDAFAARVGQWMSYTSVKSGFMVAWREVGAELKNCCINTVGLVMGHFLSVRVTHLLVTFLYHFGKLELLVVLTVKII